VQWCLFLLLLLLLLYAVLDVFRKIALRTKSRSCQTRFLPFSLSLSLFLSSFSLFFSSFLAFLRRVHVAMQSPVAARATCCLFPSSRRQEKSVEEQPPSSVPPDAVLRNAWICTAKGISSHRIFRARPFSPLMPSFNVVFQIRVMTYAISRLDTCDSSFSNRINNATSSRRGKETHPRSESVLRIAKSFIAIDTSVLCFWRVRKSETSHSLVVSLQIINK